MKKLGLILLCTISMLANAQSSETKNMYNLLVKFTVKADAVTEFKEACISSLIVSRKEAGNVEMKLYADDNKNNVFFVYSRWKNEAAYEKHTTLSHSINIAKVAKESLQTAPVIMVLGTTTLAPEHDLKQLNPEDQEETIFFIFKIKEGYRERIIERFETHVKHSRTEQGNLLFDFYTIDGEENTFVVYENWRNKSAIWDIHMKQSYSEVTGALINEAMIGEMDQYMNFVSEIKATSNIAVQWHRITTKQEYLEKCADNYYGDEGGKSVASSDGKISGKFGDKELKGTWEWKGEYFSRTSTLGEMDLGSDDIVIEVTDTKMRLTLRKGTGMSVVYDKQ